MQMSSWDLSPARIEGLEIEGLEIEVPTVQSHVMQLHEAVDVQLPQDERVFSEPA